MSPRTTNNIVKQITPPGAFVLFSMCEICVKYQIDEILSKPSQFRTGHAQYGSMLLAWHLFYHSLEKRWPEVVTPYSRLPDRQCSQPQTFPYQSRIVHIDRQTVMIVLKVGVDPIIRIKKSLSLIEEGFSTQVTSNYHFALPPMSKLSVLFM